MYLIEVSSNRPFQRMLSRKFFGIPVSSTSGRMLVNKAVLWVFEFSIWLLIDQEDVTVKA